MIWGPAHLVTNLQAAGLNARQAVGVHLSQLFSLLSYLTDGHLGI